jgi:hypothetical protein
MYRVRGGDGRTDGNEVKGLRRAGTEYVCLYSVTRYLRLGTYESQCNLVVLVGCSSFVTSFSTYLYLLTNSKDCGL